MTEDDAPRVPRVLRVHETRTRAPKWLLKIVAEVLFISIGVFLALMGDQWRDRAHARELTRASLQRFRTEIVNNRAAVEAEKDYRIKLQKNLQDYLATDSKRRQAQMVQIQGLRPAFFDHTTWDLALATQSLADIDPDLAFELSRIYGLQSRYEDLTRGIVQAIYIRPIEQNMDSLSYYYNDAVLWDAALLSMYTDILPQINRALGQ